ncbi:hypothetical protein CHS0354_012245 [Potamilus streckersoni]|uniref:Uncharacterized protein n=1 Tax=Potamilus streckersoni TaxID=2493646 RepID=A0AAE0SAM1_9BIVA|nr:hypothetical protein CHS0354_012245 [Potamilus streckersoni]
MEESNDNSFQRISPSCLLGRRGRTKHPHATTTSTVSPVIQALKSPCLNYLRLQRNKGQCKGGRKINNNTNCIDINNPKISTAWKQIQGTIATTKRKDNGEEISADSREEDSNSRAPLYSSIRVGDVISYGRPIGSPATRGRLKDCSGGCHETEK